MANTKPNPKYRRFVFRMSDQEYARLELAADRNLTSMNSILRLIADANLPRLDQPQSEESQS